MTIPEQMQVITAELISQNGIHYRISSQELKSMVVSRFGANPSSIIPSDYCYNRVNKGITFLKHPRLLAHVGHGIYECLGENYPYNEPVFARPKESKSEVIVGVWENGIFCPNNNWDSCFLK